MCAGGPTCVWLAACLALNAANPAAAAAAAAAVDAGAAGAAGAADSSWAGRLSSRVAPPSPPPAPPAPRGMCLPYQGRVCSEHLYNQSVFVQPRDTLAMVEERVRAALSVVQGSPDLSQECAVIALPAICLAAFPPCGATVDRPQGRRVCRDECELLRDSLCKREYAIARAHPIISQIPLPVCERLPPVGNPAAEGCLRLGLPTVVVPRPSETCYQDDGAEYSGMEARTASGRRCRAWSRHEEYASMSRRQPALLGGHAFCRNWDGLREEPWCFTASGGSAVQREVCGLPRCAHPLLWYIWYIAVPCGAVAIVCSLSAMVCCLCRCARCKQEPTDGDANLTKMTQKSPLEMKEKAEIDKPQVWELPIDKISFKEELGEGQFGKVFLGELAGYGADGSSLPVAVKTLKEGASARTQSDFGREWRLMTELRHPNIVRLLGVVREGSPQCLVFERMTGGDLHAVLVSRSPREPGAGAAPLTCAQLVDIAVQVADGMAYLSSHHYVHRDLAARNCLVGDRMTVKISDFGLSRDIYSSDYYRLQTRALLPVRWMPAESILYGKFTTESDVHSYGVLLWEIFSFGLQPYYGYSSVEVVEMVRRRQLLPQPEDAPAALYQLMMDCWHQTPGRRPRFDDILARLRDWQRAASGYSGTSRPPSLAGDMRRSQTLTSASRPQTPGSGAELNGQSSLGRSSTLGPGGRAPAVGRGFTSLPRPPGSMQTGRSGAQFLLAVGPASASLPRPAGGSLQACRPALARSSEVVLGGVHHVVSTSSLPDPRSDMV